jgi:hypothetical protein
MKRLLLTSVVSAVVTTALNLGFVYAPQAIQRYYPQGSMNYSVPLICLIVFVVAVGSLWQSSTSTLLKVGGTLLVLFGGTT